MKRYAIIVAGGSGDRFGSELPKQFHELDGTPVLMHTIRKFEGIVDQIIVTLPAGFFDHWNELCSASGFTVPHDVVQGGTSRSSSVRNGLDVVENEGSMVAVHDGVRPLISKEYIKRLFATAEELGNAIPVVKLTDSIRELYESGDSGSRDRDSFRLVQTPQVFRTSDLKQAYETSGADEYSDDATVVELSGKKLHLAAGEPQNIKITSRADLEFANYLIKSDLNLK